MDGKARSDQGSRPGVGLVKRYRRRNFARKQQGYEGGCTWQYNVPQLHASSPKRPSMPLVELMADGRMGGVPRWAGGQVGGPAGLMMEGWRGGGPGLAGLGEGWLVRPGTLAQTNVPFAPPKIENRKSKRPNGTQAHDWQHAIRNIQRPASASTLSP